MNAAKLALLALALGFALPAHAQEPPPKPPAPPVPGQVTCTEPRPEACTREYNPVCATRRDGARRTYSTGCTACSDRDVISHIPGPCS